MVALAKFMKIQFPGIVDVCEGFHTFPARFIRLGFRQKREVIKIFLLLSLLCVWAGVEPSLDMILMTPNLLDQVVSLRLVFV